jgi:DNA repair exonuclease SbcCD ATPase subunit
MSTTRLKFDLQDDPLAEDEHESEAQQQALVTPALSAALTFMRRLEKDLADLRTRVDQIAPPSPVSPSPALSNQIEDLRRQLAERDLELERFRRNSPEASMRILEEQRDQARQEAAASRADLGIQAAELETKDERALETQQQSLRTLEERFAEYAARLQDIRFERMQSASPGGVGTADGHDSSPGLLALFRQVFSRPSQSQKL